MNKLKLNSDKVYEWSSAKIECPDVKLSGNNYNFYKSLKIDAEEYDTGSGVLIKCNQKVYFACVHYFYDINYTIKNRYRIAVELFYRPNEIQDKITAKVNLDLDYEVIKKETLVLQHFNVTSIVGRCLLVYGIKEEDPLDLMQEFASETQDPIYICRFVACFNENKYILREAVDNENNSDCQTNVSSNKIIISDSENERTPNSKYKNFSVTTKIDDKKILLKIKRKSEPKSPSTLIKNLHISESEEILTSNFQHLQLKSPEKMLPVVLLDRVNIPETSTRKSRRISERQTPKPECETRSRRTTRKSYAKFYDIDTSFKCAKIDEENVPQTPKRKKRTNSVKIEVTPKKLQKTQTPKSLFKQMTPSIKNRDSPIVFGNTPMSRARLGLSAHNLPMKIPCREAEYLNIYNFVSVRIKDQTSGCMYISGVPGTGKTMTVCKVMCDMSEQKEDYGEFVFLKLNALALTEPRQIYVQIVKKLLNKKLHWEEALKEMNHFFKAKKKKMSHVILIDELDKLCNRKQDVVYNLLDLPFNSVTPLIVITIANTMDLPERILSNKVNSRLGLVRQTFKPYQYKDLVKIVTERLAADTVFKNEALELVARKVAAVSGDARRALTMCSRATEIAEEENKDLVSMDIVDRVVKEMNSSSKVQAIQCCSKLEQFVLSAIANEVTRTGNEEVPFTNMLYNLEKLCVLEDFKLPALELILKSCHNLGSFRLLITQHGRTDLFMTLMLNISVDDVHYALNNN